MLILFENLFILKIVMIYHLSSRQIHFQILTDCRNDFEMF